MPGYRITITPNAKRDLEDIRAYTVSQWGTEQAKRYFSLLWKGMEQLLDNPLIGTDRQDIRPGYRSIITGRHIVFYSVQEADIHILGIVNTKMDTANYWLKSRQSD